MKKFIFLTVGELPSARGLITSQLLYLMSELKKEDYSACYVGVVPLQSYIRDKVLSKNDRLKGFKSLLAKENIEHRFIMSFLRMASPLSFLLKKWLSNGIANRVLKHLDRNHRYIFHCRGYYSSYVANIIKERARAKKVDIKVIFDMRSLFTLEFPIQFGRIGTIMFGLAKEWEHHLLVSSDLNLVTAQKSVELLRMEHGSTINIHYIPNAGLKANDKYSVDVKSRWKLKRIGYIGGIGGFHSQKSVKLFLDFFELIFPDYEQLILCSDPTYKRYFPNAVYRSVDHREMEKYYEELTGLVIPGNLDVTRDFFRSVHMRVSLFSTKAAEALSRGVPLIVSSRIEELAEFVVENRCGFVLEYDEQLKRLVPVGHDYDELKSYEFWKMITENAYKVGISFTKESIISAYKKFWEAV